MINVESTVREVTDLSLAVRRELERRVAIQSNQARLASLEALVLRHGRTFFRTVAPTVHQIAPPGECYRAALRVCLCSAELTYCFGFATAEDLGGVILPHAWVVTREGVVVDPTWGADVRGGYVGATSSLSEVAGAGRELGVSLFKRVLSARG